MSPVQTEHATWEEAKRIFAVAVSLPQERRQEFLERECRGNAGLLGEVASLLESYARADSFLEAPLMREPVRDSLIGFRIGPYRVLREIGRGGMGIVYLAERADDQFRRRVALKAVRPECLQDHVLRRFENERRTLAVLDHPNIVRLLDGGTACCEAPGAEITDSSVPYLVTEYVEGESIDRYCGSHNLTVRERLSLFRQVLSAVHYAHQNLVVHRDLKPSNILVTPEGLPKLVDFGIAKLLRPEYLGGPIGLTRTAMQPMTPAFASPEQLHGEPVTTASDIYSCGVVLYRLLTGHHPFDTKTYSLLDLERAICETEPVPPSSLTGKATKAEAAVTQSLRGDLDNIVLMAMRKEPQRRYASAEHFSEDLRRYLECFPVVARPQSAWYRASKFMRRNRAACAASLLFATAVAVSSIVALREKRIAETRFDELRSFANFVIRDFDDTLIKGVTPARRKLNGEALRYLDGLAKEASHDPALLLDLAEGYTRAGDVQGNPNGANLGDMSAAERSYSAAIRIAEKLPRMGEPGTAPALVLAKAQIGLADVLWPRGTTERALYLYRAAIREVDTVLAGGPESKELLKSNYRGWDHMMSALENRGDLPGALQSAEQCLTYAERLGRRDLKAYVQERTGRLKMLQGRVQEGERDVQSAVATYEALGYGSASPGLRRTLEGAWKSLGDAQRSSGKQDDAERSYRMTIAATGKLAHEDPRNVAYQLDLGQSETALIDLLIASGKKEEARAATAEALEALRPVAEHPAATAWQMYYYTWILVTTPFPELADHAGAMRLARRMLAAEPADPEVKDVMARACTRNGDLVTAASLEREALSANPTPEVRERIEAEISSLSAGRAPKPAARQR